MLGDRFKAARRASVPIVGVTTPDAPATVIELCAASNGKATDQPPKLQWDFARGFTPINDSAKTIAAELTGAECNPFLALTAILRLPPRSLVFVHLANRWLVEPGVVQSVANVRDAFKSDARMLVLLGPAIELPAELQHDVVMLDEPLPDSEQLGRILHDQLKIVRTQVEDPKSLEAPTLVPHSVEALRGLSAFAAEQIVAMSLSRKGLDVDALWERKRQQIEQTPGLRVFRGGERFDAIGGVGVVKSFVSRVMQGNARPNAVVFVDEIEKMLGGAKGDMSGVTQDQLGALLSYMQDHGAAGMIFVGPPGAAKSAIAKAAGNEGGVPTIQLDLGAAKGSLVGQSEQQLRAALKVITAVSNGKSLWIATCNSIGELPPELRRRFTLGTFFFDLPDGRERAAIWDLYLPKYALPADALPSDEGWTGAEIRQCCDIAWRLGCTLKEASAFIVPVARSASEQIERLRASAEGRFLSASHPGVYTRTAKVEEPRRGRRLAIETE